MHRAVGGHSIGSENASSPFLSSNQAFTLDGNDVPLPEVVVLQHATSCSLAGLFGAQRMLELGLISELLWREGVRRCHLSLASPWQVMRRSRPVDEGRFVAFFFFEWTRSRRRSGKRQIAQPVTMATADLHEGWPQRAQKRSPRFAGCCCTPSGRRQIESVR